MSNALTLQARALYDALSAALGNSDVRDAAEAHGQLDDAFDLIDTVLAKISGDDELLDSGLADAKGRPNVEHPDQRFVDNHVVHVEVD